MNWQRDIELLTPMFCRGAYQDTPEVRVPSIRGMARWWFRALGGTAVEERSIFGGVHGQASASRLVFRVTQTTTGRASPNPATLPHKTGGQANPQAAFAAGGSFQLQVLSRLGQLPAGSAERTTNALEVWLLLGSLGLRANRAGGSIWPASGEVPQTAQDLAKHLKTLGCSWPVRIASPQLGVSLTELRSSATDTVEGYPAIFGSAFGDRVASRIKFKIVRLDGQLRLLITAPEETTLNEARSILVSARKPLGQVEWDPLPAAQ